MVLFVLYPLSTTTIASSETLKPEFQKQKLLPSTSRLERVQYLKLPGLKNAVAVIYSSNPVGKDEFEADAALLALGPQGPYKVWQAEPINSQPEPFSGVYFLGPSSNVPIFLFCHEFGVSVGVHMEAYRWEGQTFKSLGPVPLDGYETLKVVSVPGKENMVVVKSRYQYVEYLIYRKGRLVEAPKDYVKEYYSKLKKDSGSD
jgi:hypothetical protein